MSSLPIFAVQDRRILRDLARRVAEIADDPVMGERRQLWSEHNSLRSKRPMMLIFPEGSWVELIPEKGLQCESEWARAVEMRLRQTPSSGRIIASGWASTGSSRPPQRPAAQLAPTLLLVNDVSQ